MEGHTPVRILLQFYLALRTIIMRMEAAQRVKYEITQFRTEPEPVSGYQTEKQVFTHHMTLVQSSAEGQEVLALI